MEKYFELCDKTPFSDEVLKEYDVNKERIQDARAFYANTMVGSIVLEQILPIMKKHINGIMAGCLYGYA